MSQKNDSFDTLAERSKPLSTEQLSIWIIGLNPMVLIFF